VGPAPKPEDAAVAKRLCGRFTLFTCVCLLFLGSMSSRGALGQDLPEEVLQVDFSGYFDSFNVNIVYPSVSLTRHLNDRTAVTARYLVDVISAASMRSRFPVDAVTSATSAEGGADSTPDELRHEAGIGITRVLGKAVVGADLLYSVEHDYTSATIAARASVPFAQKNTTLQAGLVTSWDKVFPQHRTWRRDKRVLTLTTGLTQILSKRLLARLDASYTTNTGYLADPYQVVNVFLDSGVQTLEIAHPDSRERLAAGLEVRQMLKGGLVMDAHFRWYQDDWGVASQTWALGASSRIGTGLVLAGSARYYRQSAADFFLPRYETVADLRTVDTKLDRLHSFELTGKLTIEGNSIVKTPLLGGFLTEDMSMVLTLGMYARRSDTPNWFSRQRTLYAYLVGIGYRYNF
jgi:Protein of unknown function (DUF3570)